MGIVTDAEKWYFMECMQDSEGKPSFKLSKPLFVTYEDVHFFFFIASLYSVDSFYY